MFFQCLAISVFCLLSMNLSAQSDAAYPVLEKKVKRAAPAMSNLMIELIGLPDLPLDPAGENPDFNLHHSSWYGEKKHCTLYGTTKNKLDRSWKMYQVSFASRKSGRIWLQIGGRWARESGERYWILVNRVELNGTLLPNGDFREFRNLSKDREVPEKWRLGRGGKYFQTGGDKDTPVCLVNHDNRLITSFEVEAGKTYTVSVKAKLPSGRYAPQRIRTDPKKIF